MTTKACCDGGLPANDNSRDAPKGELLMLGDLPCYEVGHGAKAVIAVYDIFGFDVKRTKLVCDQISQAGYRVILPDFFRGSDVLKEFGSFPPPGGIEDVVSWVTRVAPFDKTVKEVLGAVTTHLESKGAKSIGILGFCWGGKIVMKTCTGDEKKIKCGCGIHPSFLEASDVEAVNVPQAFMPAGNDPPIDPVWDAIKRKPFHSDCFLKVFKESVHGWSLRSDMSDARAAALANEAIELTIQFFNNNL